MSPTPVTMRPRRTLLVIFIALVPAQLVLAAYLLASPDKALGYIRAAGSWSWMVAVVAIGLKRARR